MDEEQVGTGAGGAHETASAPRAVAAATPVVLVPGFWLGAWAWDAVADALRDAGFDPRPVTLPGQAPGDPRDGVTREQQVGAVVALLDELDGPVLLVGHSGGGAVVGEVVDRRPERVARVVYVDSGPLEDGAVLAPGDGDVPLPPWSEVEASSLVDLDDAALAVFRERAVPVPALVAHGPVHVSDPRRLSVPATVVCTSISSEVLRTIAHHGPPLHTELGDLADVTYVDLPTGHWPMFSRPAELARVIAAAVAG
ncbi:alpha/beta fold hydrolase [Cellulomonas massiliensis]|uniref:alpha/beta fold hydrolase n=1 Tax=Cellulomonas massiliensis TaxID=1465811 RepID=UPI0002FA557A|nr:alpha/beta hydrolase [Cellulomonas massiliensis]